MNDNVIAFTGETYLDIPVDKILNSALSATLDSAIVIGRTQDGNLYISSSMGDSAEILMMLEITKMDVMEHVLNG